MEKLRAEKYGEKKDERKTEERKGEWKIKSGNMKINLEIRAVPRGKQNKKISTFIFLCPWSGLNCFHKKNNNILLAFESTVCKYSFAFFITIISFDRAERKILHALNMRANSQLNSEIATLTIHSLTLFRSHCGTLSGLFLLSLVHSLHLPLATARYYMWQFIPFFSSTRDAIYLMEMKAQYKKNSERNTFLFFIASINESPWLW